MNTWTGESLSIDDALRGVELPLAAVEQGVVEGSVHGVVLRGVVLAVARRRHGAARRARRRYRVT